MMSHGGDRGEDRENNLCMHILAQCADDEAAAIFHVMLVIFKHL